MNIQACIHFVSCFYMGGGAVQETLRECATNMTWIAKSASWYMNDPLKKCNIWYVNGLILPNLSQNWIKFIPGFLTSLYLNKLMVYLSHNQCYDYCEYESVECNKVVSAFSRFCRKGNSVLRIPLYFIVFLTSYFFHKNDNTLT